MARVVSRVVVRLELLAWKLAVPLLNQSKNIDVTRLAELVNVSPEVAKVFKETFKEIQDGHRNKNSSKVGRAKCN
jgi:hypothetical protein